MLSFARQFAQTLAGSVAIRTPHCPVRAILGEQFSEKVMSEAQEMIEREAMEVDVVIVGGLPDWQRPAG